VRAADLELTELLDFDPERGRIQFRDHRMLLWDAGAFGSLRKELIDSLGVPVARGILRRFGFAAGYADALTTKSLFAWETDQEWWLTCPALQRHEGKVQPDIQRLVVDRAAGEFELEVHWSDSYEASEHMRMFGPATEPVCWTLAGYASGFSTAVLGDEVFVTEHTCAAAGDKVCRVAGKTRAAWGDDGDALAAEYEAREIAAELEALEGELHAKSEQLRAREDELRQLAQPRETGRLIARSPAMERVIDLSERVARVDVTVLLTGESGVGKEQVARHIHELSPRAAEPFVALNCGALPETLLESELFGHVKGAFTGATADKKGLFEAASGGTLLLDEIGETTASTQVKLLRVLEEREVRPVGATSTRKVDMRVLAATNRDLEKAAADGTFREDLLYRLKVVRIEIPPLRERRDDVLPLARHFLAQGAADYHLNVGALAPESADALLSYAWPGNVRELRHAIEHALVVGDDEPKLALEHLPPEVSRARPTTTIEMPAQIVSLAELERRYILAVLDRLDGSRTRTAKALGIGTNTLWRKLKRYAGDT
jgi:transcriptional regulator with PAS, ATPase and Fis domain